MTKNLPQEVIDVLKSRNIVLPVDGWVQEDGWVFSRDNGGIIVYVDRNISEDDPSGYMTGVRIEVDVIATSVTTDDFLNS